MRIAAQGVGRSFGPTRALDGVSIVLEPGRIHALVGENGAGKSTLLKILAGSELPDQGDVRLDGEPFRPRSLHEAAARGVGLVRQEMTINPSLTVAENVFVGQLRRFRRAGVVARRRMEREAQAVLDGLSAAIDVRRPLRQLDLGQWKCIEIARALSFQPRVLLLDESTAYLNHLEVDAVLGAMEALKRDGITVAFVSHHLAEVERVADRLTILKDGRHVGDWEAGTIGRDAIQSLMVGRETSAVRPPRAGTPRAAQPVLEASGISVAARLRPTDLALQPGEIVGLAGLKGAGGEALIEVFAGVQPANAGGSLRLDGAPFRARRPREAWRRGIASLPGDRTGEGLIVDASVVDNLVMARPPRRGPFFDRRRSRTTARALIERIGIKTASVDARTGALSGGNMQKVLLGKCLAASPRILLLNNPTRGVDIGARLEIYRILRDEAARGLAVLVLSEDLNELRQLCDRLLVMRDGAVSATIERPEEAREDDIIRHMT